MSRSRTLPIALALAALAAPPDAGAQAFLQWDQAPRVLGMGGAAVALADDPSAAFYSPAAIAWLPGTQVQVGAALAARDASFDAYGAPDAEGDARAASPALFASHAIAADWTGGISVTAPWRSEVGWQDGDFVGRFRATEAHLRGVVFNPVVAWRPFPDWSVAAGIAVLDAGLEIERFEQDPALSALAGGGPIALARRVLDLQATGVGWNAAARWRASDRLAIGLQFRSRVSAELNGSADYTIVAPEELRAFRFPSGGTVGERLDRRYVDQTARARLAFPATLVGGAAWSPIPPVVLAADLQWVGWDAVDELSVSLIDTTLGDATPLDYDDAWALRLGVEAHPRETLRFRVGFAREWSPAPFRAVSPLLPDADRSAVSLGAGTRWGGVDLDLGYRLVVLEDREGVAFPENQSAADGRFESVEHRLAIAATRRF